MIANAAPRRGELPQSMSAERALLGALLVDADEGWDEGVHATVKAGDFFFPPHRAIYAAIRSLATKKTQVTCPTVTFELSEQGVIDDVDAGVKPDYTEPYLVGLMAESFAATGCIAFARIVRDCADRRRRIEQGARMVAEGYQGNVPDETPLYERDEYKDLAI